MDIIINSSSPYKNILEEMLKNKEAGIAPQDIQLPVDNPEQVLSSVAPKASGPTNLMAQNFADAAKGESKYIKARKNALESDKSMLNRQNSILAAALAEKAALGEDASHAALVLIGKKAARRIREEMSTSVKEESEKHLEKSRKKLEQETKEILAPKDANGNPIPELNPELDNDTSTPSLAPEASSPTLGNPESSAAIDLQAEQAATAEPAPAPANTTTKLAQLDKYI